MSREDKEPVEDNEEKQGRKISTKKLIAGGVILLVAYVIWWGTKPIVGTMHVGICRTYVELTLRYPETLRLSAAEVFERSQRLYYTYIDAYGQNRSSTIDCRFLNSIASGDYTLETVTIDRRPESPEDIARFNKTIDMIVAGDPNLIVPPPFSTDLRTLKNR